MNISQKGAIELIGHEGMCLRPYLDSVGVWTLGCGATASEGIDIKGMSKTDYVSVQYIMDLFNKGIHKYEDAITKALKVPVSQTEFDALVSVCYNIGCAGAAHSTFMRRINAEESGASVAAAKEARLFKDGVYSNGGKALLFDTNGAGKVSYKNGKTIDVEEYL